MRARFILGRAGTGKTHLCLSEIREALAQASDGPPLLLLVPEQATYQMDRTLLSGLPGGASARAAVTSFRRLTFRLLGEVGGGPEGMIQDLGRQMIVHALLQRHAAEMRLFTGTNIKPGLLVHLGRMIQELRRYCIESADLQQWMDALHRSGESDSLLAVKLHDLNRIYEHYLEACDGDIRDEEDLPELFREAAPQSRWLDGATMWVDSFSDFTKQEIGILHTLARRLEQITFSLALDPNDLPARADDPTRLFAKAERTYEALGRLLPDAATFEVVKLPSAGPAPRFRQVALAHVESKFLEPSRLAGEPSAIRLVEAGNRRAEVDACARAISKLVRDHGYRYRDVAVVVRELSHYHDLIEAAFSDLDIPLFIDQRRGMAHHPLVELTRCAVRIVTDGWTHDYVIPYLRTGLAPIGMHEVDTIDNYALERGIVGDAWHRGSDWRIGESDAESAALNLARRKAFAALRRFQERLSAETRGRSQITVRDLATAIVDLFDDLDVVRTLENWRLQAENQGRLDVANEHIQVWDAVIELLDEMVSALDKSDLTLPEFAGILEAGLASLSLALIPPALDGVLVGSIERSRQPELKAVFVLGVTEREFPLLGDEDPILNDTDRLHSTGHEIELGPTSEHRFYHERYLGYVAFTRASDYLWLSYPIADSAGKPLNPSSFVDWFRACFPTLQLHKVRSGYGARDIEDVLSARDVAGALVHEFRKSPAAMERSQWSSLSNHVRDVPSVTAVLAHVLPSLQYANRAQLAVETAHVLFGDTLTCSVSRLETFAACPFKHFARYGLRLTPRKEFRLDAFDLGNLYHAVLKYFFDQTRDRPWPQLTYAEAENIVDAGVDQEAAGLRNEILLTSARNRYVREQSRRHLKKFVHALLEHARRTDFQPVAAELGFGDDGDAIPPLTMPLSDGRRLLLHGRIDRIDTALGDGFNYLRTVDYKTRSKALDLSQVYHGLDLQLLAYLLVLQTPEAVQVLGINQPVIAGAFYNGVLRKMKSSMHVGEAGELDVAELVKGHKLRGVFRSDVAGLLDNTPNLNGWSKVCGMRVLADGRLGNRNQTDVLEADTLYRLLEHVRQQILRHGQAILDGEISVAPAASQGPDPCNRCEFRSVCRLESPFNAPRQFASLKKNEIETQLQP